MVEHGRMTVAEGQKYLDTAARNKNNNVLDKLDTKPRIFAVEHSDHMASRKQLSNNIVWRE